MSNRIKNLTDAIRSLEHVKTELVMTSASLCLAGVRVLGLQKEYAEVNKMKNRVILLQKRLQSVLNNPSLPPDWVDEVEEDHRDAEEN